MRVSSVSGVYYKPQCRRSAQKKLPEHTENVQFKGKFGQIVGGTLGAAAVVTAAIFTAPAVICLAGAGVLAGAVGGDVAEDKVNGEDTKDENKGKG